MGQAVMGAAANLTPGARRLSHLLLVEDEVLIRMVLADQLREEGYKVVEASDADEALTLLRHDLLHVDVAITDIRMPGSMDGVGLARVVRLEHPEAKIILMSSHRDSVVGTTMMPFFQSRTTSGPSSGKSRRSLIEERGAVSVVGGRLASLMSTAGNNCRVTMASPLLISRKNRQPSFLLTKLPTLSDSR
jgi:CheY-like chemotaxis protein